MKKQIELFEEETNFAFNEWQDMPEFIQELKDKPFAEITFRFKNENDLKEFSILIGQKLTIKTKAVWHPEIERGLNAHKIYIDES